MRILSPLSANYCPLLLKGARLVDPRCGLDSIGDILIEKGKISRVSENIRGMSDTTTIDVSGAIICPAFCDAHVHLRTPGQEEKEDIISGCHAAARGGITTMVTMPNTKPPVDDPSRTKSLLADYRKKGSLEIQVASAITIGRAGKIKSDWKGMVANGAVALTDDGDWVADDDIMRAALEYSAKSGIAILSHAEVRSMNPDGAVNESIAKKTGVPGMSRKSEYAAVRRDIGLCSETGGRLHIQHISTNWAVSMVRDAKRYGHRVTCEATPHHLLLTQEEVLTRGADAKMNPPLRNFKDRKSLVNALLDGTIDFIATDHAPHTSAEKSAGLAKAPFGVTGLETMFSSIHSKFVVRNKISFARLVELMAHAPREYFNLEPVMLKPGSRADVVVIDPSATYWVDEDEFKSKSRNSPFINRKFTGVIVATFHRGKMVYRKDN